MRGADVLVTLGAVPLFVYVVHIYLTHAFAVAANAAAGRDVAGLFDTFRKAMLSPDRLQGLGFELPAVFAAWLVVLVLLYPLARWFASVKARRRRLVVVVSLTFEGQRVVGSRGPGRGTLMFLARSRIIPRRTSSYLRVW